jgi:hypothetical protein
LESSQATLTVTEQNTNSTAVDASEVEHCNIRREIRIEVTDNQLTRIASRIGEGS